MLQLFVDSQSVKSTSSSRNNGYDGGKKIKGKKRHLMVDVLGLVIAVNVTAANSDDHLTRRGQWFAMEYVLQ